MSYNVCPVERALNAIQSTVLTTRHQNIHWPEMYFTGPKNVNVKISQIFTSHRACKIEKVQARNEIYRPRALGPVLIIDAFTTRTCIVICAIIQFKTLNSIKDYAWWNFLNRHMTTTLIISHL